MLAVKIISTFLLFILVSSNFADYDCEINTDSEQDDHTLIAENLNVSLEAESTLKLAQVGGKKEAYKLGLFLRNRYRMGYLSPKYVPKEIYVRSTDYDRTLTTAEIVLAALYIPTEGEVWSEEIPNWQPIPVHTAPSKIDFLLSTMIPCPKREEIINETVNSPQFKQIEIDNREFIENCLEKSGCQKFFTGFWDIYDDIYSEAKLGIPFPDWVTAESFEKIKQLAFHVVEALYIQNEISKFRSGVLLNHIVENMLKQVKKGPAYMKKLFLFSAHDMNTISFFGTLGINPPDFPPTTATIMLELHLIQNDYYVKLLYRNSTEIPYNIKIPGCGRSSDGYCSFCLFTKLIAQNRIANLSAACALENN